MRIYVADWAAQWVESMHINPKVELTQNCNYLQRLQLRSVEERSYYSYSVLVTSWPIGAHPVDHTIHQVTSGFRWFGIPHLLCSRHIPVYVLRTTKRQWRWSQMSQSARCFEWKTHASSCQGPWVSSEEFPTSYAGLQEQDSTMA